jgi:hypothetical protein
MIYEKTKTETKEKDQNEDKNGMGLVKSRWKKCVRHYSDWSEAAEEDDKFALGDQWSPEDKNILATQHRPCLTFNRIKPVLKVLSGYQRENSPRIKISPEGGEDRVFSEVFDKVITKVSKWGKLDYRVDNLFDESTRVGKSYLEAVLSFDRDPIHGELKWVGCGPWQVYVDPDCKEYDINEGAEYLFKFCKYSKAKLKGMFPEKADTFDSLQTAEDDFESPDTMKEGDDDDYGNRPTANSVLNSEALDDSQSSRDEKISYKEYWYKKYVDKYFFVDDDENVRRFNTEDEAKEALTKFNLAERKIFKRQVYVMAVKMYAAGSLVKEADSPFEPYYSGYPFFGFLAEYAPNTKEELLRVQGIVRALKDPQREKNKAKSQNLHILNTQANSGWIGEDEALTDPGWEELKTMGSAPGIVIRKKKGAELTEILPKGPNSGMIQREMQADEEFKQISNINPDALGVQDKTQSGKAISLRIRQAVLAFAPVFSNFSYTKEMIGSFILKMIPSLFTAKKIARIIGPDYMRKVQSEMYPEGLQEPHLAAMLQMIQDFKYDVEVHEADNTKTIRGEIFEQLVQLAGTPQGQNLPLELMLDYMDIGNADEIKQSIAQARAQAQAQAMQAQAASKGA